jgi:septum formation protein
MTQLVLASTSSYRRELLERLHIPFEVARPAIDETPQPGETPSATANRLAREKAMAVADRYAEALIIGSDQVAHCGNERFDKPGTSANAVAQLQAMRGRIITFHTAICVYNSASRLAQQDNVVTEALFRSLSDEEITRYVDIERPLDCAGSAKSEGLGISLLEYMRGDDPTALVGLPLITLSRMLRAEGLLVP